MSAERWINEILPDAPYGVRRSIIDEIEGLEGTISDLRSQLARLTAAIQTALSHMKKATQALDT